MEWIVAAAIFLIPLLGFEPDVSKDCWTMFRDRVTAVFAIVGLAYIALYWPAFAIIFALVLIKFSRQTTLRETMATRLGYMLGLHAVVLWAGIFCLWLLFQSLTADATVLVITGLILAGVVQAVLVGVDFVNKLLHDPTGSKGLPVCGSLGQKTYVATYLAIIAPLVATERFAPLLFLFFAAIMLTGTRIPPIIACIGVCVVKPILALGIGAIALIVLPFVFRKLPHFWHDSFAIRWKVWKLTFAYGSQWPYWLIGRGHNSFSWHSLRWSMIYQIKEAYVHTHNDYLQFFFEYGAIGIAAIAIFAFPVLSQLRLGHELSGSVIAIALFAGYNFPFHIAPIGVTMMFLISALLKGAV